MSESTTAKFCTVKIKSMNGRYASGGVNIAAGPQAKMRPEDICRVPESTAKALESCDSLERTTKAHNCELVNGAIVRG